MTEEERSAFETAEREFYAQVSEIFGVPHQFKTRYLRRTRWNNRIPGNGRFESIGLVRMFSKDRVHIVIKNPATNRLFDNVDDALGFLRSLK